MLKSSCSADPPRRLICNADDFGLSAATNRGIIQCRQEGILTSASLMVRAPAAAAAAQWAAGDPSLSLGLHVELGEWEYRAGAWVQTTEVVPLDQPLAVRDEIYRQVDAFVKLTGNNPTHLDSHQHLHQRSSVKPVMRALADTLGVVLRGESAVVRFCGAFFGADEHLEPKPENVSVANLLQLLDRLQPGITEMSCHPGLDSSLNSDYAAMRLLEVATLCDARIIQAIHDKNIFLVPFGPLPRGESAAANIESATQGSPTTINSRTGSIQPKGGIAQEIGCDGPGANV